jgi:esterase/lipase superfamily enzyme
MLTLSELRTMLSRDESKSTQKDALLFVHGYNVAFDDAARRTAEMAYDLRFGGPAVFFSWPSRHQLLAYGPDSDEAHYSAHHLADLIAFVSQTIKPARIHIVAHSMGAKVFVEAMDILRDRRDVRTASAVQTIVLAAPDVRRDEFVRAMDFMRSADDSVTVYASSHDEALAMSDIIHWEPRVGQANPLLLVKGADTINASAIPTDFIGHGYFGNSVALEDMLAVFSGRRAPRPPHVTPMSGGGFVFAP